MADVTIFDWNLDKLLIFQYIYYSENQLQCGISYMTIDVTQV